MEMTLKISGRDVTFKKTGATMLLYKRLFGREYFADLAKIIKAKKALNAAEQVSDTAKPKKGKKKQDEAENKEMTDEELIEIAEQLEELDLEVYYNILYVLAKAADPGIPDQMTWLAGFDEFDVIPIFNMIAPMLSRELGVDAKNASPAAAETAQAG